MVYTQKPDRKPYCEVDDPRFEVRLLIIISVKSDTDIMIMYSGSRVNF